MLFRPLNPRGQTSFAASEVLPSQQRCESKPQNLRCASLSKRPWARRIQLQYVLWAMCCSPSGQVSNSHYMKLFSGPFWVSAIRWICCPLLPEYTQNVTAVILDEYICIILAITALIWKHVLYGNLVFSFFSNPGFRGVMGAIALSEHAWLNEEIDFVNEKCNRW